MKVNINLGSFILSLSCIPLFLLAITPKSIRFFINNLGTHPLNIALGITLISFVLGILGLKDVKEWKTLTRSILTIFFTICFSVVLIFIIFFGSMLS